MDCNLFLSIITLGIYSAWAKVRRISYFRSHTSIESSEFAYHATGLQILKGRALAIGLFLSISVANAFLPFVSLLFYPLIFLSIPWLINNSMRFNARMTSFRNVRFNWRGTYWKSFFYFLVSPLLSFASVGFLLPWLSKKYYSYYISHHTFGKETFQANIETKDLVVPYLVSFIAPVFAALLLYFSLFPNAEGVSVWQMLILLAIFILPVSNFIYRIFCRNVALSSSQIPVLADFSSRISPLKLAWVMFTNAIAVILSLGLLLPWTQIRLYRHLCEGTSYRMTGDLNKVIGSNVGEEGSFGEEFSEMQDFEAIF